MVLLNWSHQAVVHHTDAGGNTPLHYAAEIGDTVIMLELIKARAHVNAKLVKSFSSMFIPISIFFLTPNHNDEIASRPTGDRTMIFLNRNGEEFFRLKSVCFTFSQSLMCFTAIFCPNVSSHHLFFPLLLLEYFVKV